MIKSGTRLYEELKKEGLVDFSREKFFLFLVESGLGRQVKEGRRTRIEVEDEEKVRKLLQQWRASFTPSMLMRTLDRNGFEVSRASLYRYLRKLPPDVVLEIKGLGKRYKLEALNYITDYISREERFSKSGVTRFPAFPQILDFLLKKGVSEIRILVIGEGWFKVKEKTFFFGVGQNANIMIIVPSRTEGEGVYAASIKEPLISKVLQFRNTPTFTSLYLGRYRKNMAIFMEAHDTKTDDVSEAIRRAIPLIREESPEGLELIPRHLSYNPYEEPHVPTEVYYLHDDTGAFEKVASYQTLFVKVPDVST